MRESYRAKRSRQARISREKEERKEQKKFAGKNSRQFNQGKIEERNYSRNSFEKTRSNKEENKYELTDSKYNQEQTLDKVYDDIVAGRNAVRELLKSGKDINKIFVTRGEKHGSINEILALAREQKIVIVEVEKSKLDTMAENHQGIVAVVPPFNYCEVEDIINLAKEKKEDPFILILDGIEDPHNLGSIIRTAETAGIHGIIIPKRRTAQVNSTVSKVSAGAVEHMKIARVNNINETISYLKEQGVWIIGTDGEAKIEYYNQDLKGPLGIIVGSEGFGMSRLVKENADILVKIPMKGKITSLNASVSAGIVIYEAVKQRK